MVPHATYYGTEGGVCRQGQGDRQRNGAKVAHYLATLFRPLGVFWNSNLPVYSSQVWLQPIFIQSLVSLPHSTVSPHVPDDQEEHHNRAIHRPSSSAC